MALDCDGTDDEIDHGDIPGIDGGTLLTAMGWFFIDTLELNGGLLVKGDKVGGGFAFEMKMTSPTSTLQVRIGTGGSGAVASQVVASAWAHFGFVYNGGGAANADRLKMYKNGVELSITFSGTIPATMPAPDPSVFFTMRDVASTIFTDGKAALVRAWTAALTADEIAQEFNSVSPARTANLVLLSPYDDGTKAVDYSGNGNHGTVTGALAADGPYVGGDSPVRYY